MKSIVKLFRNNFKSFLYTYCQQKIGNIIYPLHISDSHPIVEYVVNKVAEQTIESNINYYQAILSQGELSLATEIGHRVAPVSIIPLGDYVTFEESQTAKIELIQHLESLLGEKLFENDIQEIAVKLQTVMREQKPRKHKDKINDCFRDNLIPFKLLYDENFRIKVSDEDGKEYLRRYSLLEKTEQHSVLLSVPPVAPRPTEINFMDIIDKRI